MRGTRAFQNLILAVFAIYALVPVYLIVLASMRSEADLFSGPLTMRWPINLENFRRVWVDSGFSTYFTNSLKIAGTVTALVLLAAPLAGLPLPRCALPGARRCSRCSWPDLWCRRPR